MTTVPIASKRTGVFAFAPLATLTLGAATLAAVFVGHGEALAASVFAALAGAGVGAALLKRLGLTAEPRGPVAPRENTAERGLAELTPLLEALPDPALLVDPEERIAGSNAAARRQLQFEASGLRLSAILRHPELLDAAQAAALDGKPRTVEYETASHIEEHTKAYVAPIAWGAQSAALIVFHDQTARIATERMRADFLANASHELRTPLASLTLLIETLSGPARGDTAAEGKFLRMMEVQADRMRRLIDDLLSLSKIELDEHVPPTDRADLADIAAEAVDALAPLAAERDVAIEVAAEQACVIGDRFQLAQVAQNLIGNAIKYSPTGGLVRVEIGRAESREDAVEQAGRRLPQAGRAALLTAPPLPGRRYAYLRVADQGPGIARRHLPRLGERFFRPEQDRPAERSGTGLGLAIVKHVMNRHRGGFLVESVAGEGSAFAIYLEQAPEARSGG